MPKYKAIIPLSEPVRSYISTLNSNVSVVRFLDHVVVAHIDADDEYELATRVHDLHRELEAISSEPLAEIARPTPVKRSEAPALDIDEQQSIPERLSMVTELLLHWRSLQDEADFAVSWSSLDTLLDVLNDTVERIKAMPRDAGQAFFVGGEEGVSRPEGGDVEVLGQLSQEHAEPLR